MKSFLKITIGVSCLLTVAAPLAFAASQDLPNEDITSSNFSLVVCDGPAPTGGITVGSNYRVCDFSAAMREVQHIMNIMVIFGVLVALLGFCYSGFLYIYHGSEPKARGDAAEVFKKVFVGIIIMLVAWFIVYQILDWIQCKPGDSGCKTSGTSLLQNS